MVVTSFEDQQASLIGEEVLDHEERDKRARERAAAFEAPAAKRRRTDQKLEIYKAPEFDPEDARLYADIELNYDSLPPSDVQTGGDAVLSQTDVVRRRLEMLSALQEMYKEEYWRLLEELNFQHHDFRMASSLQAAAPPAAAIPRETDGGVMDESGESKDLIAVTDVDQKAASLKQQMGTFRSNGGGGASAQSLDLPTYSEAEAFIVRDGRDASCTVALRTLQQWKESNRQSFKSLERLEQAASAMSGRELDEMGGIACLCGRHKRLIIKETAVSLGRSDKITPVDLDLGSEGDTRKISRHQARIVLGSTGIFTLTYSGKRWILVNGKEMKEKQTVEIPHLSLLDVGGLRFLFMVNHAAVERVQARMAQITA